MISNPKTISDFLNYISYSISGTLLLSVAYVKLLWKYNPFVKIPRLHNNYHGYIDYRYDKAESRKEITFNIDQDLFSIKVSSVTDENISATISSNIVFENGQFVLYYIYITNPKSKYVDTNPIQYGTCRLVIDDVKKLTGKYWTTSRNIGDIYLIAEITNTEH